MSGHDETGNNILVPIDSYLARRARERVIEDNGQFVTSEYNTTKEEDTPKG
jgi:hypothetical protein